MPRPPARRGPPVVTNAAIDAEDYRDTIMTSLSAETPECSAAVKAKLNTLCKTPKLASVLRGLVVDVNRVVAEAYALTNFHVTRLLSEGEPIPRIDRNLYYRALVAVTDVNNTKLFGPSFAKSVEEFDLLRPSTSPKSKKGVNSVLADLSVTMATMATNHLWGNLRPRLRRYLSWKHPELKKDHTTIIEALVFKPTAKTSEMALRHAASKELVLELRPLLPLPSAHQFKSRAHLCIPLYARILADAEAIQQEGDPRIARRARLFTLLPRKGGFTISNVPVSKMTLLTLLKSSGLEKFKGDGRDEDHLAYWRRHFNLNAFETHKRRFAGTATTDGVSISMLISHPTSHTSCSTSEAPALDAMAEGTVVSGVDPGFADIVTATRTSVTVTGDSCKTWADAPPQTVSYSSAKYYHTAKIDMSRQRTNHWNKETEDAVERVQSPFTVDLDRAKTYVQTYLAELPALLGHRAERGYRGMRFTRYVHRQKAIDDICAALVPDGRPAVVAFGDWSGGYQSPVSRRCAGPLVDIKRQLSRMANVTLVNVDEFRTSVTCSNCQGRLTNMTAASRKRRRDGEWSETFGKIHKVLHCRTSEGISACRGAVTWNRDVNASRNILEIVRQAMMGRERPSALQRLRSRREDA